MNTSNPATLITLVATSVLLLSAYPGATADSPADSPGAYVTPSEELIQWRTWGESALQEAQRLGRPILLNLGTMWCQDCSRMSATYADPGVAELVNEKFIPIKLDQDRYPHLAARFHAALRAVRDSTGLPLTGFLTSEGQLFVAGTYFAAEDSADGYAGLRTLARHVSRQYLETPGEYHGTAQEIANLVLQESQELHIDGPLDGLVGSIVQGIAEAEDREWGSFGGGPQRPQIPALRLALELAEAEGSGRGIMTGLALRGLTGIADGGIRDILHGGFHDSTVDKQFRIPRFEKTLDVNAGLLAVYALAHQQVESPRFERIASDTLAYILETLADDEGGYYAAQAANTGPNDLGSAYTWTMDELKDVLPEVQLAAARAYFDWSYEPNLVADAPTANILVSSSAAKTLKQRLQTRYTKAQFDAISLALNTLRESASEREMPPVDRHMYTSKNGLAIEALLVASRVLGSDEAAAHAIRSIDRFLAVAWTPGVGFARGILGGAAFGEGLLADQVHMANALLAAYEQTGSKRYLEHAVKTMDVVFERFMESGQAVLRDVPRDHRWEGGAFMAPLYPLVDDVVPGANAAAVLAEERLGRLRGDPTRIKRATELAMSFAGSAFDLGTGGATLARAVERIVDPPPRVVIIAPEGDAEGAVLARTALNDGPAGVAVSWSNSWDDLGVRVPRAGRREIDAIEGVGAAIIRGRTLVGATSKASHMAALLGRAEPDAEEEPEKAETASPRLPPGVIGFRTSELDKIARPGSVDSGTDSTEAVAVEPKPTPKPKKKKKSKRKSRSDELP